jgi:putative endonuclease
MPEATERQSAGNAAETVALAHLQAHGLQLVQRNARFKVGEIDLVMRDGETVVFVEVRLRNASGWGDGFDSVDRRKRRKLVRAAQAWLAGRPALADATCRFDVVAVRGSGVGASVDWQPAAFSAGDV